MRYFDHNATSPLCEAAREAWLRGVTEFPGNPSSPHRMGARAQRALDEAREEVATVLGVKEAEVVWTSGATESNNTLIRHFAVTERGEAWVSAVEHPCVRAAVERWLPGRHRWIPVTGEGVVDWEWILERSEEGLPGLVVVMAANNETGVLQPWREVAAWCRERGIVHLCDASQWLGKLPALGLGSCTQVTGCAHKFGGPQGVGFLTAPGGLHPLVVGGPQEEGRRAGTENVAGAMACAAALRSREAALAAVPAEVRARGRDAMEARVLASVPGVRVLGGTVARLWNTSALLMPPVDCRRRWVVRLDRERYAVSTGSACASGKEAPSHVLAAMGVEAIGERMLRASGGWETGVGEWEALGEALIGVAREFGCVG